jgi:hypothetical protein
MNTPVRTVPAFPLLCLLALSSPAADNLVPNGGFEETTGGKPAGWSGLWSRDGKQAGGLTVDTTGAAEGQRAARIEHRGKRDWSLQPDLRLSVKPGDMFVLGGQLKAEGSGTATLCAILYNGEEAVEWSAAARSVSGESGWKLLRSRLVVPGGVTHIVPRLIGHGPATVHFDAFSVVREGNIEERRPGGLPRTLTVANAAISVAFDTLDGSFGVKDLRTGKTWSPSTTGACGLVLNAKREGGEIRATWLHPVSGIEFALRLAVEPSAPELILTLDGRGEMGSSIAYPPAFATHPGMRVIVPMNEGISYPVDDPAAPEHTLIAYGGHGICMAFWGVTDGDAGHMGIIETPDDARLRMRRKKGNLHVAPLWEAQRGQAGYARRLRFVFFDKGGHVAMCKRYRAHARATGLLKTLAEKRAQNPNVDLLIGAVNVWCWEGDAVGIIREMQTEGIERILWSNRRSPEQLKAMNAMEGVLTSRYDIYQDLMDPEIVKTKLHRSHGDWTQGGFPKDIMLDERGKPRQGWRVKGKDGVMYPCAVLCDKHAPNYARKRVPEELKTHPYRSRFIDTTTASPWRECYHPDHPMTRTESRIWKMELLRFMSEEAKLVTGCETGHEASVPYLHYFEGMLSLGPFRVPDAGREMAKIWDEVPERVAKFQVGHAYRLPLWELVYHDCVVAQWYWGDYNNKLPALWDKRDLFNALYGTPPMFMFNRDLWKRSKARFVRSYQNTCPVARATGYSEMTDHRILTPDRSVQQSVFANGTVVTVNFGGAPHRMPDGTLVEPMGCLTNL